MAGEPQPSQDQAKHAPSRVRVDGRSRRAKEFKALKAEWIARLPPTPAPTRIQTDLIERGVALSMKVRELEADLLAGRRVEAQAYERLLSLLVRIQRTLGILPDNVSPKRKGAKPGPKPSNLSPHAKAVLKATGGGE